MQQHAVPQEIMSVEFKLFGNFLSLREFIFIAVSLAISWILYTLMSKGIIPGILAYPGIFIIATVGIMAGLVPFQQKTLDKWIINYFNAIRTPTQRIWKKPGFEPTLAQQGVPVVHKNYVVAPPASTETTSTSNLKAASIPNVKEDTTKIEKDEQERIKEIAETMNTISNPTKPVANTIPAKTPAAEAMSSTTVAPTSNPTVQPKAPVNPVTPASPLPPINPSTNPNPASSGNPATSKILLDDSTISKYQVTIPGIADSPNMMNFSIKDNLGKQLGQVVAIVKNERGEPIRASISNPLGLTINATPLSNGTYIVNFKKDGYIFPELVWTMTGKNYKPIEIKAL